MLDYIGFAITREENENQNKYILLCPVRLSQFFYEPKNLRRD